VLDREGAERQDVVGGIQHVVGEVAESGLGEPVDDVAELRPGGVTVGLLEDRPDQGGEHVQAVAAGSSFDRNARAELLAQLGDVEPQGAQTRVRNVLTPQVLHQPIWRKDMGGA
jgi:hypothetical protein